jgi:prolipoprotein diacylglyceryltransferase
MYLSQIVTSIPSPAVSFIELGPLRIHFYALLILTGRRGNAQSVSG